jgi:hypothetical protein
LAAPALQVIKVRRNVPLVLLLSLAMAACANTVWSTDWSTSGLAEADLYARAAGLTPLRNGGGPEVRVWVENVMFGEVAGRVTTADHVAEYAMNEQLSVSGEAMTVTGRANRPRHLIAPPASLAAVLSELRSLDGQNWGCAADGDAILVDGVADGHRLVFSVSNPELCNDDRSRLVLHALDVVAPTTWSPLFGRRTGA